MRCFEWVSLTKITWTDHFWLVVGTISKDGRRDIRLNHYIIASFFSSEFNLFKPDHWNVNKYEIILEEVADISILLIETRIRAIKCH